MATKVIWLSLAGVWGTTWLAISVGLRDLPPITFAGIRFFLAGLFLWAFVLARGAKMPLGRKQWALVLRTGFLIFVLGYSLQFWGMQFVTSGMTAVMFSTTPAMTLVIGHFVTRSERFTFLKVAGVLLGVIGVGLIFSDQLVVESRMTLYGSLACLAAAAGMARAQVDIGTIGKTLDPATVAAIQMTLGGLVLFGAGVWFEGNPGNLNWTATAVGALLYLSLVGSAFGFLAFYWLLQRIPVANASAIMLIHPVVAIALGVVFLGEELSGMMLVGAVVIVAGLGLILKPTSLASSYVPDPVTTGQHRVVFEAQ